MEEVLLACLDEVALSGLEGCTLNSLWMFLSTRHAQPLVVDASLKAFLWRQLCMCKGTVQFYLLPRARESSSPPAILDVEVVGRSMPYYEFIPSHPFRAVNEPGVCRGSCTTHKERRAITRELMELSEEDKSLDKIEERYGSDNLLLVGSQQMREKALIPSDIDPSLSDFSDLQYSLLEVIGSARHYGIFRTNVTRKFLKIDARSTFHHVKMLEKAGLIVVKKVRLVIKNHTQNVHIVFLTRFTPTNWFSIATYEEIFCSTLHKAPNRTLPARVIKQKLRKHYRNARANLLTKQYIRAVNIEEQSHNGRISDVKCWQLIVPYTSDTAEELANEFEDEEEEEETVDRTHRIPVVAELPLTMQAYQVVDDCGPAGITNPDFTSRRGLDVSVPLARHLIKNLQKSSAVVSIILDCTPNKTVKLVSQRHAGKNIDLANIKAEQVKMVEKMSVTLLDRPSTSSAAAETKLEATENMETNAESNTSEDLPSVTTTPTNAQTTPTASLHTGQTPPTSVKMAEAELPEQPIQTPAQCPMSLQRLRRCNIILKYMEGMRILNGHSLMIRHIRETEKETESKSSCDRKSIKPLLEILHNNKQLMSKTVSATSNDVTTQVILYYIPEVTEEELTAHVTKAENWLHAVLTRRESRNLPKKRGRPPKKKMEEETEDVVEDEAEEETEEDDDVVDITNACQYLSGKFQRLRHFHYFLWLVMNGQEQGTDSIPAATFPWAAAVDPSSVSPSARRGEWLHFRTALQSVPISLLRLLIPLNRTILDSKLMRYISSSRHDNTIVAKLPESTRILATNLCRNKLRPLLEILSEMKLVELDRPLKLNKVECIKLVQSADIVDTRTAKPRRSFFLAEALSMFNVLKCPLHSATDLEHYWYTLHNVCLGTAIILIRRGRVRDHTNPADDDEDDEDDDEGDDGESSRYSSKNDVYPLEYHKSDPKKCRAKFDSGFGAGGLHPLSYSHLAKNWASFVSSKHSSVDFSVLPGKMETESSYGPGMELSMLPSVTEEDWNDSIGESSKRPAPQDGETTSGASKRMRVESTVVRSDSIKAHTGGKGLQRNRLKMAQEAKKRAKKLVHAASSSVPSRHFVNSIVPNHEDTASTERSVWYPYEDSLIVMCYIASRVVTRLGQPPVDVALVRDALHRQYKKSEATCNKTASAVYRRLYFLLRHRKDTAAIASVCQAEVMEELQKSNIEGSDQTLDFEMVLQFIIQKYKSCDGQLIVPSFCSLPNSLEELSKNYELIGDHQSEMELTLDTNSDLSLLTDLIIATVGADPANYDAYSVFKVFATFPENELKAAYDVLKRYQLIASKRLECGIPRPKGPLYSQSFRLSTVFSTIIENLFPTDYFTSLCSANHCLELINRFSSDDNSLTDDRTDTEETVYKGEAVTGEEVSAVVNKLFCAVTPEMSGDPVLPNPMFLTDDRAASNALLQSALDEPDQDDDSDEEMEVESGGVARDQVSAPRTQAAGSSSISILLNIDEVSPLQHGSLVITPGANIGSLLDPSERVSLPEQCSADDEDSLLVAVSFDEFLVIARERLGYSMSDCELAKELKRLVEGGKEGVRDVSELCCVSVDGQQKSTEAVIQDLVNFEQLYRVGSMLVADSAHKWHISVSSDGGKERGKVKVRPWVSVTSHDPNMHFLNKVTQGVLTYIISHPGINLSSLLHHFKGIIHLQSLRELLQSLEAADCIKLYTLLRAKKHNLFSRSSTVIRSSRDIDLPEQVFVEPSVNADITWSQLIQ